MKDHKEKLLKHTNVGGSLPVVETATKRRNVLKHFPRVSSRGKSCQLHRLLMLMACLDTLQIKWIKQVLFSLSLSLSLLPFVLRDEGEEDLG